MTGETPRASSRPNGERDTVSHQIRGLESFLDTKHVHWDFDEKPKDFWYPYGR